MGIGLVLFPYPKNRETLRKNLAADYFGSEQKFLACLGREQYREMCPMRLLANHYFHFCSILTLYGSDPEILLTACPEMFPVVL